MWFGIKPTEKPIGPSRIEYRKQGGKRGDKCQLLEIWQIEADSAVRNSEKSLDPWVYKVEVLFEFWSSNWPHSTDQKPALIHESGSNLVTVDQNRYWSAITVHDLSLLRSLHSDPGLSFAK